MNFSAVAAVFVVCLSTALATYGPEYKNNGHNKPHFEAPPSKVKIDEPRIHLDSPKIILDRPSINVHGSTHHASLHHAPIHHASLHHAPVHHESLHHAPVHHESLHHAPVHHAPLLEDEPIILENDKPLYIRKTLHGIPATQTYTHAHQIPVPVLVNAGYSSGKVLDVSTPYHYINHAPVVHEQPIFIRRPIVVSKGLATSQDHLEKLHYAHSGGYSLGEYATVPVSKGLHERTVVYSGLGHGYGGHIVPTYSAPVIVEQPKSYIRHGYSSAAAIHHGTDLHGHGGHLHAAPLKKY